MDHPFPRYAPLTVLLAAFAAPLWAQDPAGPDGRTVERESLVMGTRLATEVEARAAPDVAEEATAAVRRVEALLSTWKPDSELSALNAGVPGEPRPVSPELLAVLLELGAWVEETGGAFDPAVGALVDAWGLRGGGRAPTEEELDAARSSSGWSHLTLDPAGHATLERSGVWLDAGAFGKGLALRKAAREIQAAGGTAVLNFGGQVTAVGTETEIGVAHAEDRGRSVAQLRLRNASAATTSAGERSVEVDGRARGHILDPRTGEPVGPWGSVTVVAEDPMVADILSTALFVMGPDAALEWAAERPYGVLVQELGATPALRWNAALESRLVATALPDAAVTVQDTSELERLKRQVEAITRELERIRLGSDVVPEADSSILGFGPAASKVYAVNEGVSIGGYGEILYVIPSGELEDGTESTATSTFDALRGIVYLGYKFNDRVLVNTEIEIEHGNEAFLEFAYLDYKVTDSFGLRGGLLLAPLGLVNELHEPPVFLGTTRPLVEQRIIPTTWRENGLGVFGDVGPVSYRAYIMNGLEGVDFSDAGLRGGRQKGSKALAEDLAVTARADYTAVPGLLVGGSVYYGGSGQGVVVGTEEVQANTFIWEGHASYQARGLDLRGLVAGATVDQGARGRGHPLGGQ
ncbi:MAG: FAD:protein FMN transferase [Gemmatimonadota bacterium]